MNVSKTLTRKIILDWSGGPIRKGSFQNCQYSKCTFTRDRRSYNVSDIVIFVNGFGFGFNFKKLREMKKTRPPRQGWLLITMENPVNTPKIPDDIFELFANYKRGSDVSMPLGEYKKLTEYDDRPDKNINYALGKTKQISWLVSHCGTLRDGLVHKLESYGVSVHVGGRCAGYFKHKLTCKYRNCTDELKDYKFYLSAENNLCDDYITEKYWRNALMNNLLPIVFGGSNYSDAQLAIPGSFINVFDFYSIRKLAEFIKKVDKDDDLYNSYFQWKQKYSFRRTSWPNEHHCDLCKLAHNIPKKYKSIPNFFSYKRNCRDQEKYYNIFRKRE